MADVWANSMACQSAKYLELYFKVPSVSLIMLIMFSRYVVSVYIC